MRACHSIPTKLQTIRHPLYLRQEIAALTGNTPRKMSLFWSSHHPSRSLHSHHHPSSPSSSSVPGFSSLFRMLDDFERYAQQQMGSFSGATDSNGNSLMGSFAPRFDVTESEKEYNLQGELPGVPTENVEIEFTDPQTLIVRGHVERKHTQGDPSLAAGLIGGAEETKKIENGEGKSTKEKKDEGSTSKESPGSQTKYWLSERSYGQFSRVFTFPSRVDQDKVTAKFNNGILDITVPKIEKQGVRKITVS